MPNDLPRTDFSLSISTKTAERLPVDFVFTDPQILDKQDIEKTSLLSCPKIYNYQEAADTVNCTVIIKFC